MAAAVAMLDALRKKPVAEKKKQFSVAFFIFLLIYLKDPFSIIYNYY